MMTFNSPLAFANRLDTLEISNGGRLRINNVGRFWDNKYPYAPEVGADRTTYLLNKIMHLAGKTLELEGTPEIISEEPHFEMLCPERVTLISGRGTIYTQIIDLVRMMLNHGVDKITLVPGQDLVVYRLSEHDSTTQMANRCPQGCSFIVNAGGLEEIDVDYLGIKVRGLKTLELNGVFVTLEQHNIYKNSASFIRRLLTHPEIFLPAGKQFLLPGLEEVFKEFSEYLPPMEAFEATLSAGFLKYQKAITVTGDAPSGLCFVTDKEMCMQLIRATTLTTTATHFTRMLLGNKISEFTIPKDMELRFVGVEGDILTHLNRRGPLGFQVKVYTEREPVVEGKIVTYKATGPMVIRLDPMPLKQQVANIIRRSGIEMKEGLEDFDTKAMVQLIFKVLYKILTGPAKIWLNLPPEFYTSFTPKSIATILAILQDPKHAFNSAHEAAKNEDLALLVAFTPEKFDELDVEALSEPVKTVHRILTELVQDELQGPFLKKALKEALDLLK